MEYKELCKRINIEKYSNKYLKGKADADDIDVCIKNIEDEKAYCFVHINDVQMKFRRIQLVCKTQRIMKIQMKYGY